MLPVYHPVHIKATGGPLPNIVAIAEQAGSRITDLSVAETSFEFLKAACYGPGMRSLASTILAGDVQ